MPENKQFDKFNEMCSVRGLFFPSAEIYSNNFAGFYEYGPIGAMIKNRIVDFWRKEFVKKNNFLEISGSAILPESVFKASGHIQSMLDPIATCSKCNSVYRLDKLISEVTGKEIPESLPIEEYSKLIEDNKIVCIKCKGQLKDISKFNLMFSLNVGSQKGNTGYLRPETCQSIFLDFQRIYKMSREGLPIGISQCGKSFRNEISPRNGLIRCREFEQMESELFFDPDRIDDIDLDNFKNLNVRFKLLKDDIERDYSVEQITKNRITVGKLITYYLARTQEFMESIGFKHEFLRYRELSNEDRAFYSKQTFDLEIKTKNGWIELFCINYRTDHDLRGHSDGSKKDLSVSEDGKVILPHVLEVASIGLDRLFYVLLENSFSVKEVNGEERNVISLKPRISPYFCAVLSLVKKDGLSEKAQKIYQQLLDANMPFEIFFDEKGSIGKRYARLDEIGCNYCLTIDHQTLEDNTVTIRDRDSFDQKRIKIEKLDKVLTELYFAKISFSKL